MPDPVTNNEIEDVLTSIRRLVSENRRDVSARVVASTVSAPAEQEASAIAPASPALVLTPALRVAETAPDAAREGDEEAVFADMQAEVEEDHSDEVARDEADARLGDWHVPMRAGDAADAEDAPLEAEDVPEASDIRGVDTLDTSVAEVFDAMDDDVAVSAEEVAVAEDAVDEMEQAFEDAVDTDIDEGDIPDSAEAPFDFQQVLEARLVDWQDDAPSNTVEEPDAPGDSDYAGTETAAASWSRAEGVVTEAALDALEEELGQEFEDGFGDAILPGLTEAADDATVIDEEMLREMVADIVRQELQGALGERITRNVRKLVRREIHRALAAHDLD